MTYEKFGHNLTIAEKKWIFKKFQFKWKIVKHFMRPIQRAALSKSFSLPTLYHIKSYYISRAKVSHGDVQKYTDICFQSASRKQFLRVQIWCRANVFSDTKQKHVCCKLCRVTKVFGCVAGAYYFQCQVSWGS